MAGRFLKEPPVSPQVQAPFDDGLDDGQALTGALMVGISGDLRQGSGQTG
jgi:hypothetical protein